MSLTRPEMPLAYKEGCFFCPPEEEQVIYRNWCVTAFWDKFPVTPGHALIVPNRHAETWMDITYIEKEEIARASEVVISEIKKKYPEELGFNLGVNIGKVAGQSVMHCHMHVIPRRPGDSGSDPRGGVRGVIPSKKEY